MFWAGKIKEFPEAPFMCPSMIDSVPDSILLMLSVAFLLWLL